MDSNILDFINKTNATNSAVEVVNFLESKTAEYGCDLFAFGPSTPAAAKLMTGTNPELPFIVNYPKAWVERYLAKNYFEIDPVIKFAATTTQAFSWRELKNDKTMSNRVKKFWKESEDYGLKCGITVPLHCPKNQSFVLSLVSSNKNTCLLCANIDDIQLIAYQFTIAYFNANKINKPVKENPLTEREREVLNWTAQGKSAWDIGVILNISEHTVNFHLKNIIKKLDVTNKTAAVVKGLRFGYIFITY